MTEKLLAPVCIAPEPHTEELLIRLQTTRKRLIEEEHVPKHLIHDLIQLIDDSYNFIACCEVREVSSSSLATPEKEREKLVYPEVYEVEPDSSGKSRRKTRSEKLRQLTEDAKVEDEMAEPEHTSKRSKTRDTHRTPQDRQTKPNNAKPIQRHLSDRLDEEPIDF